MTGKHREYKGGDAKGLGRHRDDGTPCELGGVHDDQFVNRVHFSDDLPGVRYDIRKCTNCGRHTAQLVDGAPKHRK